MSHSNTAHATDEQIADLLEDVMSSDSPSGPHLSMWEIRSYEHLCDDPNAEFMLARVDRHLSTCSQCLAALEEHLERDSGVRSIEIKIPASMVDSSWNWLKIASTVAVAGAAVGLMLMIIGRSGEELSYTEMTASLEPIPNFDELVSASESIQIIDEEPLNLPTEDRNTVGTDKSPARGPGQSRSQRAA